MTKDFANYRRGAVNLFTLMRYVKIGAIGQDAQKDIPKPVEMVINANLVLNVLTFTHLQL